MRCVDCGHFLTVALHLYCHHRATQTGPYHYDGWSSMGKLLEGDPPLVWKSKKRFKLTQNGRLAGAPLAAAIHEWCHAHGNCPCQDVDFMV